MQSDFWAGSKYFGPVQNILGPVKRQGISKCQNYKADAQMFVAFSEN